MGVTHSDHSNGESGQHDQQCFGALLSLPNLVGTRRSLMVTQESSSSLEAVKNTVPDSSEEERIDNPSCSSSPEEFLIQRELTLVNQALDDEAFPPDEFILMSPSQLYDTAAYIISEDCDDPYDHEMIGVSASDQHLDHACTKSRDRESGERIPISVVEAAEQLTLSPTEAYVQHSAPNQRLSSTSMYKIRENVFIPIHDTDEDSRSIRH